MPDKDAPALPGPKKKQAQACFENVDWMVKKFGEETIGFLTMTAGDYVTENGRRRFVKVSCPVEFQRRYNSLLTNVIRPRYRCGVGVIEPFKGEGLHVHLVAAMGVDLKTGFDFDKFDALEREVADGTRAKWRASECGANENLAREWAFWRRMAARYGFGRCNLQPVKSCGEAVARYVAKYITKGFEHRRPEHKGMRMVRYFGNWQSRETERAVSAARAARGEPAKSKAAPRFSANRGSMTPRARAWRECVKQIAFCSKGQITQDNVKHQCGTRWAWGMTKQIRATEFIVGESARWTVPMREAMGLHNEEVRAEWGLAARGVWERHPSFFLLDTPNYDADGYPALWLSMMRVEQEIEWQQKDAFERAAADAVVWEMLEHSAVSV